MAPAIVGLAMLVLNAMSVGVLSSLVIVIVVIVLFTFNIFSLLSVFVAVMKYITDGVLGFVH